MSDEDNNSNNQNDNDCPPIEIGLHQNSYQPKNTEKRGSNKDE